MSKLVYSVKEFAEAVDMHEQTIYEKVRLGEIRGEKIGKSVKIPVSELRRLNLNPDIKSSREIELEEENKNLRNELEKYKQIFTEMNGVILKAIS